MYVLTDVHPDLRVFPVRRFLTRLSCGATVPMVLKMGSSYCTSPPYASFSRVTVSIWLTRFPAGSKPFTRIAD